MNEQDFIDQLKRHEGYSDKIYADSVGVLTCGIGHALHEGSFVPHAASKAFFEHDLAVVNCEYLELKLGLDPVREYVIKNMLFNLGLSKLLFFRKMLTALMDGDYRRAADEMLKSKWARQVKSRAWELAAMMRSGEYHE